VTRKDEIKFDCTMTSLFAGMLFGAVLAGMLATSGLFAH
jgi:hypothetical protein